MKARQKYKGKTIFMLERSKTEKDGSSYRKYYYFSKFPSMKQIGILLGINFTAKAYYNELIADFKKNGFCGWLNDDGSMCVIDEHPLNSAKSGIVNGKWKEIHK